MENRVYCNFCKKILTLNGFDVAGICTGADFEIRAGKTPKITLYLASDVILDVEGDVYGKYRKAYVRLV